MARDITLSHRATLPSDEVLCFAWTIVRSKPAGFSIADYIARLRVCRSSDPSDATQRRLNVDGFWKSEAERLSKEVIEIRQRLAAVELERANLQERLKEQDTPVPGTKKRKKANSESTTKAPGSLASDQRTVDSLPRDTPGALLLQHLFDLSLADDIFPELNDNDLVHHLISAADAITGLVDQVAKTFNAQSSAADLGTGKTTVAVVERAFPVMIASVGRLKCTNKGADARGHVIYSMVQTFQRILDACLAISVHESQQSVQQQSSRRGRSQKRQDDNDVSKFPVASCLGSLLCRVMKGLDPKLAIYRCLYEGFAYCAIDRASTRLHVAVFGWSRRGTMEEELSIRISPTGVLDHDNDTQAANELTRREAKIQAPFLIKVVELVTMASRFFINPSGDTPSLSIAWKARERLQHTLVTCMLGTEPNAAFEECLKMPIKPASSLRTPNTQERPIEQWFANEMWQLIGWDILAREHSEP